MIRRLSLVVVLCLACIAVGSARQLHRRAAARSAPKPKMIWDGPLNWAGYQGANVQLDCSADPGDRVQWMEYVTSPLGTIISDGAFLSPGHPNFARYSLSVDNTSVPNWFNLTITPSVTGDGGRYVCIDETTQTKREAEIVVIDSASNCTNEVPPSGFVVEGTYYTMECQLTFQSSYNIFPVMTWSGPGNFNQLFVNRNTTVHSGINFYVQRAMDNNAYQMDIYFTGAGFGNGADMATNVPTWTERWRSGTMFVLWPPTNMTYTPVKSYYQVGDVMTCYTDANPWAQYSWTSSHDLVTYQSQTLTLTDAMVGGVISLRCQAINDYGSNNLIVNITVNARTTTGPPTTTPPTTTVPAVANCDELTGRWEFQRAADSTAVLCIYVNKTNGGVLDGFLINDTKDTNYLEIFGRTRNNIYDETGFTAIWPTQIGISAFAGECHKCYGVESFLVNAISRSSKDGEFCGDGGLVLESPQFNFHRVPISYPCYDPYTRMSIL